MFKSRTLRLTGLIIVMLGLFWLRHWRENRHPDLTLWKTPGDQMVPESDIRGLTELESMERDLEQTLWKPELEAQRHEDVMNEFWDRLNSGRDVWQTSAEPPLQELDVPEISIHEQLPHGCPYPQRVIFRSKRRREFRSDHGTDEIEAEP